MKPAQSEREREGGKEGATVTRREEQAKEIKRERKKSGAHLAQKVNKVADTCGRV